MTELQMHVGTISAVEPFPEARKPAYKLTIDFGPLGVKRSSAQITDLYTSEDLVGRQVIAVTSYPPKRIAGFLSEVLVCGVDDAQGRVVLLRPDAPVANGQKVY